MEETLWQRMSKANDNIKPITIVRKTKNENGVWETTQTQYAEVKERIIAFRYVYPNGSINTTFSNTDNYIECEATISDFEGHLIAIGHAREVATINANGNKVIKPYALENAETSAIGRALGFAGFGIKTGIASAEDMQNYEEAKTIFDEPLPNDKKNALVKIFNKLPMKDQADALNLWGVKNADDVSEELLRQYLKSKGRLL